MSATQLSLTLYSNESRSPNSQRSTSESRTTGSSEYHVGESSDSHSSSSSKTSRRTLKAQRRLAVQRKFHFPLNDSISEESEELSHSFEEDPNIYVMLHHKGFSARVIVRHWIKMYKSDKVKAVFILHHYLLNSTGIKGENLPLEMFLSLDDKEIISWMTDEYLKDVNEVKNWPLMTTGIEGKKFQMITVDFIENLIDECSAHSIVYDKFFQKKVIYFLILMSDDLMRPLRHLATFVVLKIMSRLLNAWSEIMRKLADSEESCYDNNEMEMKSETLDRMIQHIFAQVYCIRRKDKMPDIRIFCSKEYCHWLLSFPPSFATVQHWENFIRSSCLDPNINVRKTTFEGLLQLYKTYEMFKLKDISHDVADIALSRLVESSSGLAVSALKIFNIIYKQSPSLIESKWLEIIFEHVYSPQPDVAHEAGIILDEYITNMHVEFFEKGSEAFNKAVINDVLVFHMESRHCCKRMIPILVDSLINITKSLKDWQSMIDLMMDDALLNSPDKKWLINLIVCCIKRCSAESHKPSRKENSKIEKERIKITECFSEAIILLWQKHMEFPERLVQLLAVPRCFDAVVFMESDQNLHLLLNELCIIFDNHFDEDVLDEASRTLAVLCSEMFPDLKMCINVHKMIVEKLIGEHNDAYAKYEQSAINDNYSFDIAPLKKLASLYCCHDLNDWNLFSTLIEGWNNDVINFEKYASIMDIHYALKYYITACTFSLLWYKAKFNKNVITYTDDEIDEVVNEICEYVDKFVSLATYILKNSDMIFSYDVQEDAFKGICDVMYMYYRKDLMFGKEKDQILSARLVYVSPIELASYMANFLNTHLFSVVNDGHLETAFLHLTISVTAENIFKKRNVVHAYCKVVSRNYYTFPLNVVAKQYLNFYDVFGDIIESTIEALVKLDRDVIGLQLLGTLIIAYKERIAMKNSDNMKDIEELAQKFASILKFDAAKDKELITQIHKQGIIFAVSNSAYLSFLKILISFSRVISKDSKQQIITFLEEKSQAISDDNKNTYLKEYKKPWGNMKQNKALAAKLNKSAESIDSQTSIQDKSKTQLNIKKIEARKTINIIRKNILSRKVSSTPSAKTDSALTTTMEVAEGSSVTIPEHL